MKTITPRLLLSRLFLFVVLLVSFAPVALRAEGDAPTTSTLPSRIISCAPNLTEMLFALGAGDSVVGVTRYCLYPDAAQSRPKYGDLFNPSLEAMVAAKPDMLVLVPGNTKVEDYFGRHGGAKIVRAKSCDSIAEIVETLAILGDATGRRGEADRLARELREGIEAVRVANRDKPRLRVLFVVGREKGSLVNLYAVGRGTYIDELLSAANAENVVDARLGAWPVLNRESLITMNPDVIVESRDADGAAESREEMRKTWSALPSINAVRNKRLSISTNKHLMIPGPFLAKDAQELAKVIRGS